MAEDIIRAVLYADWGSNLEFSDPEKSEIVRAFRRTFGARVRFTYATVEEIQDQSIFKDNPHVFIMPGIKGEVSAFTARIGREGNANIRNFVRRGGLYFGVCAGAYYATSHIFYHAAWGEPRQRTADEILALTRIRSLGPMRGYCHPYHGPDGAEYSKRDPLPEGLHCVDPIPVIINSDTISRTRAKMAYGLGPTFNLAAAGNDENIDVLLRYDAESTPPAIIHVKDIGEHHGAAILCGVLPQYNHEHRPVKGATSQRLFNLLDGLYESREEINYVWNQMLMARVWSHVRQQNARLAA